MLYGNAYNFAADVDGSFQHDPGDGLIARRCAERALVGPVLAQVV